MTPKSAALVQDVMEKLPDGFDVKTQVKAVVAASLPLHEAQEWLSERGLSRAVVFDEDGADIGLLMVDLLPGSFSFGVPDRAFTVGYKFPEKCCPVDLVRMSRRSDEDPNAEGKYFCPRHRKYHCEPECP